MSQAPGEQRTQLDYLPDSLGMFGGLTCAQVVRPLWLVFAGGLISFVPFVILLCFTRHPYWQLHLTDQPVGAALIAIGIWQLGRVDLDREYMVLMRYILIVSLLQAAATIAAFFPLPKDPLVDLVRVVLDMASTVAVIGFCICMCWFAQHIGLKRSAHGWLKTMIVFCCVCVPVAVVQFSQLLVVLKVVQFDSAPTTSAKLSWWFLLYIPLIVAPPLAFVLSISQMRGQMRRREIL